MNQQRNFNASQIQILGNYIYILRDPRDKKVFYVGQGAGNRVFSHFNGADNAINYNVLPVNLDSKLLRIIDIWNNNMDVEWFIASYDFESGNSISDIVESAVFDTLKNSQNGVPFNLNATPRSTFLTPAQVNALGAPNVNPPNSISNVFVFPIHAAYRGPNTEYDATRMAWRVSQKFRNLQPAYGVGLINGISYGSFEIDNWAPANGLPGKYQFFSPNHPNVNLFNTLQNKNWRNVLNQCMGYWQYNHYLIIKFNGQGQFRFIKGPKNCNGWYNC